MAGSSATGEGSDVNLAPVQGPMDHRVFIAEGHGCWGDLARVDCCQMKVRHSSYPAIAQYRAVFGRSPSVWASVEDAERGLESAGRGDGGRFEGR